MLFHLRQAVPEDAEALVTMHTRAHEECYAELLPPEFFAARRGTLAKRIEHRRSWLETDEPRIIALDERQRVVGFADAGAGRDSDRPTELELFALYTLAFSYGSGLGRQLIEAAIGTAPAYLWALEANPRALAFYRKNGFQPEGARQLSDQAWKELPQLRLVREQQG